jgi:hypothetical protein
MAELSKEQETTIFQQVVTSEIVAMASLPDKEVDRNELIAMLAASSSRMLKLAVNKAYKVGHSDGYASGYTAGSTDEFPHG